MGVGGAEQSMLRLMRQVDPDILECHVIFYRTENRHFAELLTGANIPIHRVGSGGLVHLYRTFRHLQPDVVYLFSRVFSAPWGVMAKLAKVPVVIGAIRRSVDTLLDRVSQRLSKRFLDAYIANSQAAAWQVKKNGIPEQRVFVVYNGIEINKAPIPDVPPNLIQGSPLIVCVANLQPRKGLAVLLDATNRLREHFPHIRTMLVGRDYTSGRFFEDMEAAGLADTYQWAGYVRDVRGILARADVFVLPSFSEGMPTSILEAMLAEKPVVASNVDGIPELIENSVTGLLVPPGDPAELAVEIRRVLESDDLARSLGVSARAYVLSRYGISRMVQDHVEIFHILLGESSGNKAN
jgi:glycosyltransferase involved in cell wall biosynthesis